MACRIELSIRRIKSRVFDCYVGRVSDDHIMVALQNLLKGRSVFGGVCPHGGSEQEHVVVQSLLRRPPQQAVACGQVRAVTDFLLDAGIAGGLQSRDEQAESGDGDGEGVDVDPVDAGEGFGYHFASAEPGGMLLPSCVQTVERPEKEMP